MRRLILGTAGHIDHGKTTLVRALTGTDTDRLQEEKERGITIDLGFAGLELGDGISFGIVDLPGHESFIRNMLAGATGIDLALLVIAADEGVMPQTREHLAILELLGVRSGIIALTKIDLVDPEWLELVTLDLSETLEGSPFSDFPLIPVSAVEGEGIDALRSALLEAATESRARDEGDLFRLPIDRIFPVHGTGTVVTGTVWSGSVERDQRLEILPLGKSVRVRSIQVYGREAERAVAGQRAALGLVGIERELIRRGESLVSGGGWEPTMIVTTELHLLESAPSALEGRTRVRFHLGTTEVMARVVLLDTDELGPGDRALAQLRLEAPVVARAGDHFVIRSYSPITTIGGGTIIEPTARKRSRLDSSGELYLRTLRSGTTTEALEALATNSGWKGFDLGGAHVQTPSSPDQIAEGLDLLQAEGGVVEVRGLLFSNSLVELARTRFLRAIDEFHERYPLKRGIDREELRRSLPRGSAPEFGEWVLEGLLSEGVIEASGATLGRAGYQPILEEEGRALHDHLIEVLETGQLSPPTLSDLPAEIREHRDLRDILRILEEEGRIVVLGPDLVMSRSAIEGAIRVVRKLLGGREGLTAADFRVAIPVSRKYLIPILEYLDQEGVTRRKGDLRTLTAIREAAGGG